MYHFIFLFKSWSTKLLVLFVIFEMAFFSDVYTVFGCVYCLYGWFIVNKFVIQPKYIFRNPLSSFLVIGYGLCSFYFPLPATLIELKPITYNLDIPLDVFFHGILSVTMVVISFKLYLYLYEEYKGASIFRKYLSKTGFYKVPDDFQVWAMGFIGVVSLLFTFLTGGNTSSDVSSGARFIEGFIPFAYAPYFLLLKPIYTKNLEAKSKTSLRPFVFYSMIILLLAFMSNHRATFMKVIMGVGFVYFLGLLLGRFSYKFFTTKNVLIFSFVMYLLTGPLSDLGIAMVTVRGQKHDVSASELAMLTLDVYADESVLVKNRIVSLAAVVNKGSWDEHYLDNIFLARLCNLKAVDINLYHAERIKDRSKMRNFFGDQLMALMPKPLLEALKIRVNKGSVTKASYGDYLYYLSTGNFYGLESKRQSQLNGAGLASFGFWYIPLLVLVMFPLFGILDLFSFFKNGKTYITIAALTIMPMILTFFNFEGISTFVSFMFRGWLQLIFLYLILLKITSLLNIFKVGKSVDYGAEYG